MAACPECGRENAEDARFCSGCGEALTARPPERRKLATLLFCDVVGSTALGERVDPETVREVMIRYFAGAINDVTIDERLGLRAFEEGSLVICGCGRPAPSGLEPRFEPYLPQGQA